MAGPHLDLPFMDTKRNKMNGFWLLCLLGDLFLKLASTERQGWREVRRERGSGPPSHDDLTECLLGNV